MHSCNETSELPNAALWQEIGVDFIFKVNSKLKPVHSHATFSFHRCPVHPFYISIQCY